MTDPGTPPGTPPVGPLSPAAVQPVQDPAPAADPVVAPPVEQPTDPAPEPAPEPTVAELVAQAALSVPGVTGLHGGSFGEVATYLPGRRVTGVRVRDEGTSVHLAVAFGSDLREVAADVRRRVADLAPAPVEVVVEDVTAS